MNDCFLHREASEWPPKADLRAAPCDRVRSFDFANETAQQFFGEIDECAVVDVRPVKLEHRELRIPAVADAFVAEVAIDLVHARHAADDQPLQVELGRDAQKKIDVQRVVMRLERTSRGAASDRLHHRRLHLDEVMRVKILTNILYDFSS